MARPASRYPTELELQILNAIWSKEAATVRLVRDALEKAGKRLAYNTVLTMMTIMTRKGYLKRKMDKNGLFHSYTAKADREATRKGMLLDLIQRAYGGDKAAVAADMQ